MIKTMGKKWYASKTLWVNAIAVAAMFAQNKFGYVMTADMQVQALAVINMVLRVVTKEGLAA
ncbi:MAG: hypothetical protein ACREAU_00290 [Nitrosopumilaceae archaeon]